MRDAPGAPGIPPRWTSSAKTGIGTAPGAASRVWFTLSHGILNEVYYPRLDTACLRDLGLIVTDGTAFFSEEKRHVASAVTPLAPGVPGYRLVNESHDGRYRIEKRVLTDPARDVVLQDTRFVALAGPAADYHVYVLLAPHLANHGADNTAWVDDYKGVPMLFAERNGTALAVACAPDWRRGSAGFVGVSDGWQELWAHKALVTCYERAAHGNVALVGEVDLSATGGRFLVALAFGGRAAEAGHRARASLLDGFERACHAYVGGWQKWQDGLTLADGDEAPTPFTRMSAAVLRCHEEKRIAGALIASLSIPWGADKGDEDLGGYHLVWPRDLVEAAGGLLAAGACADARRILEYLRVTQNADGSWPQNMWVDGEPYWRGVQLDETAFPVLLVDLLRREADLDDAGARVFWPMVRRAASFLVRNGPATEQDRWEEDPGLSPFTLAAEVAALLAAADLGDLCGEDAVSRYLRETADAWNEEIDRCTYVTGTALAARVGVEGYYVRIAPPDAAEAASPAAGFVPIKNRTWPDGDLPASELVSPDALALVRFGLRAPDDPRIGNTVRVVDALLKTDFPFGPVWRRYNGDGYGEHDDGAAFDGTGVGRPWPLLTGERAHFELAAGRPDVARALMTTMEACANEGLLLPEQVWDGAPVPERELSPGRPSGSAMPLVWAHAEYLKLQRSLRDGRVFDLPTHTWGRYVIDGTRSAVAGWRFNQKRRSMPEGRTLRCETMVPAVVHWTSDRWQTSSDTHSVDTGLGEHIVDLPTAAVPAGSAIEFTFYWPEAERWEGENYQVEVV